MKLPKPKLVLKKPKPDFKTPRSISPNMNKIGQMLKQPGGFKL